MDENGTSRIAGECTHKRRRRRSQSSPVEEVASTRGEPRGGEESQPAVPRWRRWQREVLHSFGLSPIFRIYLFVGSVLAILAFLLYNESVIQELKEQEKKNVDLYAKLISLVSQADDEPSIAIFQEIALNPSIDFPIIVTDHRGRITQWNRVELPTWSDSAGLFSRLWSILTFWREGQRPAAGDTSATTMAVLRELVQEMDAQNAPISFYPVPEVAGYLYSGSGRLVLTDGYGEILAWRGEGLPDPADPTDAARQQAGDLLQRLREEAEPLLFKAPVGEASALYHHGENAVITNGGNAVLAWTGPDLPDPADPTDAARQQAGDLLQRLREEAEPLLFEIPAENYIHYGDSELVTRISLATFIQVGALLLFLLVGYVGFRNIKRSEQRFIWVGTAKETAHQLGTPLSSLSGWLELMEEEIGIGRSAPAPSPQSLARVESMVGEMQKDMRRLTQIASRFSQIGSVPELVTGNLVAILEETIVYFRDRSPQFGHHEIRFQVAGEVPPVPLNADLLSWAFENLFKNAIDAIEHQAGMIEIRVDALADRRSVQITFRDNGRGIESDYLARIFDPGFSTKKRGWGLGLAFAKRIIEEYHGGRLTVLQSVPGEGSTFAVVLPVDRTEH